MTGGRGWAYAGLALGGAVSIAANVRHTYMAPPDAPAAWGPEPLAVIIAMFWPVAVIVGIEILARTDWRSGWRWALVRRAGAAPVVTVAAIVSYRHLSALLAWYGEDPVTVAIGPLAVDGLMVMATASLISSSRRLLHQAELIAPVPQLAADTPNPLADVDPVLLLAEVSAYLAAEAERVEAQNSQAQTAADREADRILERAALHADLANLAAGRATEVRAHRLWGLSVLEMLAEALGRSGQRPPDQVVLDWIIARAHETGSVPSRADVREQWRPAPSSSDIDRLRRDAAQALADTGAATVPAHPSSRQSQEQPC